MDHRSNTLAHRNGGATIDTRRTRAAGLIQPIQAQHHLAARQAERDVDALRVARLAAQRAQEPIDGSNQLDGLFMAGAGLSVCALAYLILSGMNAATPTNVVLLALVSLALCATVVGSLFALCNHVLQDDPEEERWEA